MTNIVFAGFGGQGVLTAGLIVAKTGMDLDKHVIWIPSYGSEMRGGTANCNVKISDDEIASPFIKEIDVLLALNSPSVDKFENMVRPGGVMIINSSIIEETEFRSDINVYSLAATEIAAELGNARGTNIAMIGALAKTGLLFSKAETGEGIENFFAMKNKNNPKNKACFESGFEKTEEIQKAII